MKINVKSAKLYTVSTFGTWFGLKIISVLWLSNVRLKLNISVKHETRIIRLILLE